MNKAIVMTLITALILVGVPVEPVQAAEAKRGSVVLSAIMPGTGEWLNRDFEGSFPWAECIVGCLLSSICCPVVNFSSVLDAAAGDTSQAIRVDFWSKPAAAGNGGVEDGVK